MLIRSNSYQFFECAFIDSNSFSREFIFKVSPFVAIIESFEGLPCWFQMTIELNLSTDILSDSNNMFLSFVLLRLWLNYLSFSFPNLGSLDLGLHSDQLIVNYFGC